jgi:uncharacterized phiE125 gp8 family phage protein
MGIKVLTPPATEPVTLAEAKLHLRVDTSDEDALITRLIKSAREECEHYLQRSIPQQTLGLYLDAFPSGDLRLTWGPAQSITSVQYINEAGNLITLPGSVYLFDDTQLEPVLRLTWGSEWPTTRVQPNAVIVTYVAGYATACPESIRNWILLRVGTLYRFREADAERVPLPSPFADRLLDEWRVYGA